MTQASTSSVFDFTRARTPSAPAGDKPERQPAQFWLNVGYYIEAPHEQTGELEQIFVSLPFGIPLDTMTRKELRGSGFMLRLAAAQNNLLDDILAAGQSLEPGGTKVIAVTDGPLVLQVRRVGEPKLAPEENPLSQRFTF